MGQDHRSKTFRAACCIIVAVNDAGQRADELRARRKEALEREMVESRSVSSVSRQSLFEVLSDVESFPQWGYGLRRVRLWRSGKGPGLPVGSRIEFKLSAAGITHKVTSVVTVVDAPRLLEWRYLSGASGRGGWLLEEDGGTADGPVRLTLSTDYSPEPAWLDKMARRPFFMGLARDLLRRSLGRLESGLSR